MPPGGIAKRVWDTGRPYATNDIEFDPYANAEVAQLLQIRSQLSAPLLGPDQERLVEALVARFPGVDRAAEGLYPGGHGRPFRRPKKRGPFQFVPVIAFATALRLA